MDWCELTHRSGLADDKCFEITPTFAREWQTFRYRQNPETVIRKITGLPVMYLVMKNNLMIWQSHNFELGHQSWRWPSGDWVMSPVMIVTTSYLLLNYWMNRQKLKFSSQLTVRCVWNIQDIVMRFNCDRKNNWLTSYVPRYEKQFNDMTIS